MGLKILHKLRAGKGEEQVIFFPYLGGSASSFSALVKELDPRVEVWSINLPGHGGCVLEPLDDIEDVLELYCKELCSIIKPRSVFFGHSMGGVIAYFLVQKIFDSKDYPIKPVSLVLSACSTPSDFKFKNYSGLSDEQLLEHMISYGGMPEELIHEPNLLEYYLPLFRADFKILESSSNRNFRKLEIPAYLLLGENDKVVVFDLAIQWLRYFVNPVVLIPIEDGMHLFINDKAKIVAKHLDKIIYR